MAVCLLVIYIAIRTYSVDITNDEAYSFHNVKKFWYAEALCTANTHWLNSLAIKAALLFNSENNWQIRWFSTLSALVFYIIGFLWIQSLEKAYLKFFAFALLLLNPFVIDYFGLARGYASGLMFESIGMLLFLTNLENSKRPVAFAALLCSGLSAIANFSFVYFFAGFGIVYFFTYYLKPRTGFLKNRNFYIDALLTVAILSLIIRAWIFIIRCSNDTGAGTDVITDVSYSFMAALLYRNFNIGNFFAITLSCIPILLIALMCVYGVFKYKKHKQKVFYYSSLILSIILTILCINFVCFKIVLPYGRSALFMFPLICIAITYFLDSILASLLKKIILTAMGVALLFNFTRTINFTRTFDFIEQEDTKNVFNYVDSIGAKHIEVNRTLYGVYVNYYQLTDKMKYHFKADKFNPDSNLIHYDYLLFSPVCNVTPRYNKDVKLDTVKKFRRNNIVLIKINQLNSVLH
ncbi:MAG: hypothetical protein ACLQQ4_00230 [Bacteroidia bacterium]